MFAKRLRVAETGTVRMGLHPGNPAVTHSGSVTPGDGTHRIVGGRSPRGCSGRGAEPARGRAGSRRHPARTARRARLWARAGEEGAGGWQVFAVNSLKKEAFMKKYISCHLLS